MVEFTYKRGEWIEGSPLTEMAEDEDWYDWLSRQGFNRNSSMAFGESDSPSLAIYKRTSGDSYLAEICLTSGETSSVFIPDFPSMMMFIRDFSPALSLAEFDCKLEKIGSAISKLFRVYHGHDAASCCQECDPLEWKWLQEEKWKREEQKRAKAKPDTSPAP